MDDAPAGRDLALNPSLWAYEVGQTDGRQTRLTIRISNAEESYKNAKNNLSILVSNHTDAGKSWSKEELDISNAPMDERGTVVGELLPENAVPDAPRVPEVTTNFLEREHTIVPKRTDTFILITKPCHNA